MPVARRMNHVHIAVSDLERSVRFYTAVFGLEEKFRDEYDGEVLAFLWTVGDDPDVLTLSVGRRPGAAGERGGLEHFGFQVPRQLGETIEAAKANGGTFLSYADWEPEHVAYVADPDGYAVEVDARPR